jgi:16S rRNA C1402 N4-methylase RsmH
MVEAPPFFARSARIFPSADEITHNPRARSATLRVAERAKEAA